MPRKPTWRLDGRWLSLAAAIPLAIGVFLAWRILMGPASVTEPANTTGQQASQSEPSAPVTPPTADPQGPSSEPRPSPSPEPPVTLLATLILTADLNRSGGQPPTLQTSTGVTEVELVAPRDGLTLGAAQARVETIESARVWSGSITVPRADAPDPSPRARVPVSLLPPGDYFFSIQPSGSTSATDEVRYYFRVRAR